MSSDTKTYVITKMLNILMSKNELGIIVFALLHFSVVMQKF